MQRQRGNLGKAGPRWRRIAKWVGLVLLLLVAAFVIVIGPWPARGGYELDNARFFRRSMDNLNQAAQSLGEVEPAPLRVGYGHARLTPPFACPLAGYGARKGKPSVGTLDELEVEVLSLDNGRDEVVLVTADILLYTKSLAGGVWERIEGKAPLDRDDVLFTASHTHNGPGGWSDSWIEELFAGDRDPRVIDLITSRTARAIFASLADQQPSSFTFARVDAPEFVRNRTTPDGPVDDDLDLLEFDTASGREYLLLSYSAHPTTIDVGGPAGFQWSADYPGRLRRAVEERLGVEALYMAGCLGSSSARHGDRVGRELAARAIETASDLPHPQDQVRMAPLSFAIHMPPRQFLIGAKGRWRLSPIFVSRYFPARVHLRSLRLDDVLIVFCPCELSCEIAVDLKTFAKRQGLDLILTAMNGEYTGYITPDRYYGQPGYETRDMNFYLLSGGFYERLIRELILRHVKALSPFS